MLRKGGSIDQAMLKDIYANMRRQGCPVDEQEFYAVCGDPDAQGRCPEKCLFDPEDYE